MGKRFFYLKMAWSNIKNHRRIYLPYILSCVGTVMMLYILSALVPAINTESMYGGESVASVLQFGVYVIQIFAFIFLFYTNSFVIKQRKKEFGLYNILGLEKKHIASIVSLETVTTGLISVAAGLLLGILFSKIMFLILGRLLQLESNIQFIIPSTAILNTITTFCLIFMITLLYNLLQIMRTSPIQLLQGSSVGEKEPKVNWPLAVLGIICLGVGYYLSVTVEDPVSALFYFFLAVVLVIVGTYCLFTAGMIALLKMLKRKKSYYYRPQHFPTVSGMLYRMKQNAAGLATICILSTCVLVMVSTTFAMYTGMEDVLSTRYPRQISVNESNATNESIETTNEIITNTLASAGIEPLNVKSNFYYGIYGDPIETGFTTVDLDEVQSTSDFTFLYANDLTHAAQSLNADLQLAENEVFCFGATGNYDKATIDLFGNMYYVKNLPDSVIDNQKADTTFDYYYVVFSSKAVLENVVQAAVAESPESIITAFYSYSFDIDGNTDAQIELTGLLREKLRETNCYVESSAASTQDYIQEFGGLFFLGIFLGLIFLMALALIIYYKQVSEGYDDKNRFIIMQNVGMSHQEVKRTIHSQILLVFFIPLVTSIIHLAFAMPMLIRILSLMNMLNLTVIFLSAGFVVLLFTMIYLIVYLRTAKTYYKIVEA